MGGLDFDTAGGSRKAAPGKPLAGNLARNKPRLIVAALVLLVLFGGAYYNSRASEAAPKVVYTASLEEAMQEAQAPLLVNVNTADVEELDELPGVGPSTAQKIIDHREASGSFTSVEDLEAVSGIGPKTIEELRPFATV